MIPDGFILAEPIFPCLDRWPSGALTPHKQQAYQAQEAAGNIRILSAKQGRQSGITIVRYLANCPHDWFLQQMAMALSAKPEQLTIGG